MAPGRSSCATILDEPVHDEAAAPKLEISSHAPLAATLADYLADRRVRPALLRPALRADDKPIDRRWHLVINDTIDPDVTFEPDTREPETLP